MQDNDYRWFLANYHEIYRKYGTSFVVIKDKTILGSYPTYAAGLSATVATEKVGSFIIQKCTGDESGYTNYISSTNFIQ